MEANCTAGEETQGVSGSKTGGETGRFAARNDAMEEDPKSGGSICFRGSGLLLIYHIGVAAHLQEHYDLSTTRIAGTSGGSIVAGLLAAGVPMKEALDLHLKMAAMANTRIHGPFFDSLSILMERVKALLPDDETVAARCTGRLRLALTQFPFMDARLVESFPTRDLLARSIVSSMNLPLFLSPVPPIDGNYYIDGALTLSGENPVFDDDTVTVSPVYMKADIHPVQKPSLYYFVFPGDEFFTQEMFRQGYEDAAKARATLMGRGFIPVKGQATDDACSSIASERVKEVQVLSPGHNDWAGVSLS